MSDKKIGLDGVEVECGGTWKRVVTPDTYDKKGKADPKLEQGDYGTDNDAKSDYKSPIGNNIDLEQ